MRIAQVAPVFESVPPQLYGGTERVVSYLTEELVRQGHDVTLFASGDSVTRARLVSTHRQAARLDETCTDPLARQMVLLDRVFREARHFDQIHFHCDYLHFPFSRRKRIPTLTTLHGRLDIPDLIALYQEFDDMPLVSISNAQRRPVPGARWVGTVYHGLPADLLRPLPAPREDYLAALGRISPEKGIDRAIEIAGRAGWKIKIAAKVDAADRDYHERVVKPLLEQPHVEYVGEIGEDDKQEFLGNARALLFPIDWPEPFGLVMIEALACGKPVIALGRGSVPEVIEDGVSGFVVDDADAATAAVARLPELSRADCREAFDRRFTAERMAADYVAIYRRLARSAAVQHATRPIPPRPLPAGESPAAQSA